MDLACAVEDFDDHEGLDRIEDLRERHELELVPDKAEFHVGASVDGEEYLRQLIRL